MYGYQTFHDGMMQTLIESVRSASSCNAYIFEGSEGLGKYESARLFAAALTCSEQKRAPCGACPSCIGAKADTNPDIKTIDTAGKKSIGVGQIREIIQDAYIRPFESVRKVYILRDGDALTEEAQNAFLKVLEEPPQYTVFIILVSKSSMLLQTVLSRSCVLRFPPLSDSVMRNYIEKSYPDANADFLVRFSGGIPGRADVVMQQENFWELREESFQKLISLLSVQTVSAYSVADFLEEHKENADLILEFWQGQLRDVLFLQSGAENLVTNTDQLSLLRRIAGRLSEEETVFTLETLDQSREMLRRYVNLHAMAMFLSLRVKERK